MATENPPGTAAPGAVAQAAATPEAAAQAAATQEAAAQAAATQAAGKPIAEINLVAQPSLDKDPRAFGETLAASKREADAAHGGGAPIEVPSGGLAERPYNSDESRDATRQTITLWLIGLLCAVVGLTFVALFARGASTGFTDKTFFHDLKQVLDVLVGPVVTLLASAVGFYFGSKQGELAQQVKDSRPK